MREENHIALESTSELNIIRKFKENHCYVSQNFENDRATFESGKDDSKITYGDLPDGT